MVLQIASESPTLGTTKDIDPEKKEKTHHRGISVERSEDSYSIEARKKQLWVNFMNNKCGERLWPSLNIVINMHVKYLIVIVIKPPWHLTQTQLSGSSPLH